MKRIDPTFNQTVTVFHKIMVVENNRNIVRWEKAVYKDCYFGTETVKQLNGNVLSMGGNFICRIPKKAGSFFALCPEDIIVRGIIADEIKDTMGNRLSDLLNRYQDLAFTVKAVSDNTKLSFAPHIRASGV